MSSIGSYYIWGLPDMCRRCEEALASGEPRLNPAQCYPATTVDDIKDLPLRALLDRQLAGRPWLARQLAEGRRRLDRARSAPVDDLPAEPTTPHPEAVNSLPPEPEVDEDGNDGLAEDAEDDWQMIQRVLRMR